MGTAFGHAGEFLQGAVCAGGATHRILVSIPAPGLRSNARLTESTSDGLAVFPAWKQKSLKAFQLAWAQFSRALPSGRLEIESNIPVSRGLGSSTADCVAAVRAAASHWNRTLHADQIAALAHQAEFYSDATMYEDRLVVFQHCEGRIYESLEGAIPDLRLLIVEPGDGVGKMETDLLARPSYTPEEIRQFTECLARFRNAVAGGDIREIAAIAAISARINQRYHPKQKMREVERIAVATGALGVAVAHSGDIQVLLYSPGLFNDEVLRNAGDELEAVGMKCSQTLSTLGAPRTETMPCSSEIDFVRSD
jgi:uncharacterized protein involved in propanediol utilization